MDGALGALGVLSPKLRPLLAGLEQADSLGSEPELERLAPVSLHVVCFRYVGRRNASPEQLEAWNRELLCRLHEAGTAVPSYTILHDRYCLRVCINNHRTRREDLDMFVSEVLRLGREIAAAAQ